MTAADVSEIPMRALEHYELLLAVRRQAQRQAQQAAERRHGE